MYRYIILNLFLLFYIISIYSQSKIIGNVQDTEGEAVPYANVQIKSSSIGTISNVDGAFEIVIPDEYKKEQLVVSCMAYKKALFSIDSLLNDKTNSATLRIAEAFYKIQEITVNNRVIEKKPKHIFTNAINNIHKNYDNNAHLGNYYFRQIHRDDSTMNKMIEADIEIFDPGISHPISDCKINIKEQKTSLDNRIHDHHFNMYLYRSWAGKRKSGIAKDVSIPKQPKKNRADTIWKNSDTQNKVVMAMDLKNASLPDFFNKANMLRSCLPEKRKSRERINPYFVEGGPVITKDFIKRHILKLDTILMYGNEAVYKIKILPDKDYPGLEYQRARYIPIGWAYISVEGFDFLALDYMYVANPKYKPTSLNFRKLPPFKFQFKIRLKKHYGKLYTNYLSYVRSDYNDIQFAYISRSLDDNEPMVVQPQIHGRKLCIQELFNTSIEENCDITDFSKWNSNHYINRNYNAHYWDNHSSILPSEYELEMKNKLKTSIQNK